jgi:hypothetical protein
VFVRTYASLTLALLGFVCPAVSQMSSQMGATMGGPMGSVMRGEVQGGDSYSGRLIVELVDSNGGLILDRVLVAPNGQFELHSVPNRTCEIRLLTEGGDLLKRDWLVPTQQQTGFVIDLNRGAKAKERPVSGVISSRRLSHKVPKAAMKEFRKAENASAHGKEDEAIRHLEKAITLDPDFMEALNNLGTKYMREKRPADAAPLFQRAIDLDPSVSQLHVNLAVALLHLRKPAEAEAEVRKALKGQGDGSPMAKKILGISLAAQGKQAFVP